jgi:hypothetical protein
MLVYSNKSTRRLEYIIDFIGKELTGEAPILTTNQGDFLAYTGAKINYSDKRITGEEMWLHPVHLLFEEGIKEQVVDCFEWNDIKAFFKTGGDFPFDIFAASFYLLSRYEEYLPHQKDMYGRYAHENSLAYREGFLNKPLINIWMKELNSKLRQKFPNSPLSYPSFSFLPTYDIDEAYSFKYKTWQRSAGGAVRDLLYGRFRRFSQRRRVLNHKESDPFDSYSWLNDLHRTYHLYPRYFFLVAEKNGKLDKNILPSEPALQTLVRQYAEKFNVGLHPSWQSGDDARLLKEEKVTLEHITGIKIIASRQHFIRFCLPGTYRQLMAAGIKEDFSMGFGSINGFRASVASPFYWFDLGKDEPTHLLLYPFCYMDANSYFEQKQTPRQVLEEMRHYLHEVKKAGGTLITIWHNTFLGTDEKYAGWREAYAQFVKEADDERTGP